ncbi:hypothetical protein FA13DRAFT_1734525 [Coprinellus micaceus]|uniref:Uncharacterized protein n=1 Tax=Coprinellus micaceus TaxID=71717 RepID=A0A4Y7T6Z3_COPMI|nr:hypothetical protein FA13DRAFT_1734525 [Coprinellus micaceus]
MASQQGTNVPSSTTDTQNVKVTQNEAATTVGTKLPVLQHAVGILQQGLNEDTSEIPAQERKTDFTAQIIGYEDDDDEYNSDDSDDSPPPSLTNSMIERGEVNKPKEGIVTDSNGKPVQKPTK